LVVAAAGNKSDEANPIGFFGGAARAFLPGTRMAFAGLHKAEDIACLRTTDSTTPAQNPPPE
jgi:cytochrome c2